MIRSMSFRKDNIVHTSDPDYVHPPHFAPFVSTIKSFKNKEFTANFDYVMVFPMVTKADYEAQKAGGHKAAAKGGFHLFGNKEEEPPKDRQSIFAKETCDKMLSAGLEIFPYLSVQGDELIVLIRCPDKVLSDFADKNKFQLKCDPEVLKTTLQSGQFIGSTLVDSDGHIIEVDDHGQPLAGEGKVYLFEFNPIKYINDDEKYSPISPYEHIYLEYQKLQKELYWKPKKSSSEFTPLVRLKLIYMILRAAKIEGGCEIELSRLMHKGHVKALYPLHDASIAATLCDVAFEGRRLPWQMPLGDLREYFGEKITLYMAFLGHYAKWLIIPAIIGFIFQLVVWGTLNFSSPVLPFYSLTMTAWSVVMLEFWKRKESTLCLQWGMLSYESREQVRPEFKGETIKSYIDGSDILYYPETKTQLLVNFSRSVVCAFIALVIGIVAAIYTLRFYLQGQPSAAAGASTIASVLNTIQITIMNLVYGQIALRLTKNENQRTDTYFEDSLIVKQFVFQFINSYCSFFFIAFVAGNLAPPADNPNNYLGQCGYANCMQPLSINLVIIFMSRITLTNFLDVFLPFRAFRNKLREETEGAEDKVLTPAEEDYMLLNYDTMVESIKNYGDTAIQYGFTVLFITALPIACLLSLISCHFKVKLNIWKLSSFYQRPVPVGCQDIGTWQTIFGIISVVSVITNAGLICFTMTLLWMYSLQGRVWVFIGFQWVLIGLQYVIELFVPDEDEDVTTQQERSAFYNRILIEKIQGFDANADEEDSFKRNSQRQSIVDSAADPKKGCCSLFTIAGKTADVKAAKSHHDVIVFPAYPADFTSIPYDSKDESIISQAVPLRGMTDPRVASHFKEEAQEDEPINLDDVSTGIDSSA